MQSVMNVNTKWLYTSVILISIVYTGNVLVNWTTGYGFTQ